MNKNNASITIKPLTIDTQHFSLPTQLVEIPFPPLSESPIPFLSHDGKPVEITVYKGQKKVVDDTREVFAKIFRDQLVTRLPGVIAIHLPYRSKALDAWCNGWIKIEANQACETRKNMETIFENLLDECPQARVATQAMLDDVGWNNPRLVEQASNSHMPWSELSNDQWHLILQQIRVKLEPCTLIPYGDRPGTTILEYLAIPSGQLKSMQSLAQTIQLYRIKLLPMRMSTEIGCQLGVVVESPTFWQLSENGQGYFWDKARNSCSLRHSDFLTKTDLGWRLYDVDGSFFHNRETDRYWTGNRFGREFASRTRFSVLTQNDLTVASNIKALGYHAAETGIFNATYLTRLTNQDKGRKSDRRVTKTPKSIRGAEYLIREQIFKCILSRLDLQDSPRRTMTANIIEIEKQDFTQISSHHKATIIVSSPNSQYFKVAKDALATILGDNASDVDVIHLPYRSLYHGFDEAQKSDRVALITSSFSQFIARRQLEALLGAQQVALLCMVDPDDTGKTSKEHDPTKQALPTGE